MNASGELKLVFPTEEYENQIKELLKEFYECGELRLPGAAKLEEAKNYDEWLIKVKNATSEKTVQEGRVPATTFFSVRKSDNKVIGVVDIRHKLNDYLFQYGGHIGDCIRPSERRKGYATEQIKLALEECKKIGINRVLITCDKTNIGSAKSIINNGGILENEIEEDGKIKQRYWISLKKRYADRYVGYRVKEAEQKIVPVDDQFFTGDICFYNFTDVTEKIVISNGKYIMDNNYKWLEFYDYNSKIKLTAIYDENNEIVEWYFDIARKIGKENGIPYEDDLYLDVVLTPGGETILLDEDELKEAYDKMEMTKEEYDEAYQVARDLMKKIENKSKEMKEFTDKYLYELL